MTNGEFVITRKDILGLDEYLKHRADIQAKVFKLKEDRRIKVGPDFVFNFENKQTLIYQIQEMLRIEKITDEKAVQHEIDTYAELLPGKGMLSATLMIEYPDPHVRNERLKKLKDVSKFISMVVDNTEVNAIFDERQSDEDRVSSVQFLKFQVGEEPKLPTYVTLKVAHPDYTHSVELSEETIHILWHDILAVS